MWLKKLTAKAFVFQLLPLSYYLRDRLTICCSSGLLHRPPTSARTYSVASSGQGLEAPQLTFVVLNVGAVWLVPP